MGTAPDIGGFQEKSTALNVPSNWYCNQKCAFCNDGDKSDYVQMRTNGDAVVRNLLERWKGRRDSAVFTGGEPTLNPKIFEYFSWAKEAGYPRVGMITNGSTLADAKIRAALLASPLDEMTVSVHGSCASVHDAITGVRGAFDKAARGLVLLRKDGWAGTINISYVLNRMNLLDLPRAAALFLGKFGVDRLLVNTMRPEGWARDRMSELCVRYPDFVASVRGWPGQTRARFGAWVAERRIHVMDIPPCVLKEAGLDPEGYSKVEVRTIAHTVDGAGGRDEDNAADKAYVPACGTCRWRAACEGVYKDYVTHFGKEDVYPLP